MSLTKSRYYFFILSLFATLFLFGSTANAGSWRSEATIGGKLKVHVYVPTTAPMINSKRALMVSMHGCSQTHSNFKTGANWPGAADDYGMVVALPMASKEGLYGSLLGCWNFHGGTSSSRGASDVKYLINMVNAMIADSSLNIDPDQVYITGLSSGAGQAHLMACLAPDVFAGVGINAGPGPGSGGTDLNFPGISVNQGKNNCENFAASFKSSLYTQLYNNVHGANDGTVSSSHADRNTDIFVAVYEGDGSDITACASGSVTGGGNLTTYCDGTGPRISKIIVSGMGHAWPAGPGSSGGGSYIDHTHVNYPDYITEFFFDNNRRVMAQPTPTATPTVTPTATPTPGPVTPTPTPGPGTPTPSPLPPTPTPAPSCDDVSAFNYYHKVAGRATSSGNFWLPNYAANGSNDAMQGSTWGLTSLYSFNGSYWSVGSCP